MALRQHSLVFFTTTLLAGLTSQPSLAFQITPSQPGDSSGTYVYQVNYQNRQGVTTLDAWPDLSPGKPFPPPAPASGTVHWIQRVIDVYRGNVQDKIDILPGQRDLFYDTGGNADPIYFRDVPWQSRFDLNRTFYAETYLVVPSDVPAERVSKLTSQEAINPNVVEVGGIRFEILIPKRVWTIPAKNSQAKNPVEIGIRITNKTQAPVRFTRLDPLMVITLEIARLNGSLLNVHGGRDLLLKSPKFNCQLVLPGESLTFFLDAKLYWEDEQLTLGGSEELGGLWYFRLPEVGTYKARFRYYNRSPVGGCYDPNAVSPTDLPTGLWTGEVLTPFVEVQIVQR